VQLLERQADGTICRIAVETAHTGSRRNLWQAARQLGRAFDVGNERLDAFGQGRVRAGIQSPMHRRIGGNRRVEVVAERSCKRHLVSRLDLDAIEHRRQAAVAGGREQLGQRLDLGLELAGHQAHLGGSLALGLGVGSCGLHGLLRGQRLGLDFGDLGHQLLAALGGRLELGGIGRAADDLAGKAECKADLLRSFGLPATPDLPVVGITSRLVHQKGFDVVVRAWYDLLQRPLRMVVLGTGEEPLERLLGELARAYPESVAVRLGFDDRLARRIYAGADVFLMPSRYEPCGLGQLIALRYGTVPIVRRTGGLADTVTEFDPARRSGTGFIFDAFAVEALTDAVRRAAAAYRQPPLWKALVKNAMAEDFSWEASAREYATLYGKALKVKSAR